MCAFFQDRLWLAATPSLPHTLWASSTGDHTDFEEYEVPLASSPIAASVLGKQAIAIRALIAGTTALQVFTSTSEYYITAEAATPATIALTKTDDKGIARHSKPILIDGMTAFIDAYRARIMRLEYQEEHQAYTTHSLTDLSKHLIRSPLFITHERATSKQQMEYAHIINRDGTIACIGTAFRGQIRGVTLWETQGHFQDVAQVGETLYCVVLRQSRLFLERFDALAHGDHQNSASISPPANEVQELKVAVDDDYNGGSSSFRLHYDGQSTVFITITTAETADILAEKVRAALVSRDNISAGDVTVTAKAGAQTIPAGGNTYDAFAVEIAFTGNLAQRNLPLITFTAGQTEQAAVAEVKEYWLQQTGIDGGAETYTLTLGDQSATAFTANLATATNAQLETFLANAFNSISGISGVTVAYDRTGLPVFDGIGNSATGRYFRVTFPSSLGNVADGEHISAGTFKSIYRKTITQGANRPPRNANRNHHRHRWIAAADTRRRTGEHGLQCAGAAG